MLVSIIIRTYNEQKHLEQLLVAIAEQHLEKIKLEVVVVDSGSTDATLEIAARHACRVTHIRQQDFTFGRSLNYGCAFARGETLVFISGHCIPVNKYWLRNLIKPLTKGKISYAYGRQQANLVSKFSEKRHFEKWFSVMPKIPQDGYFCNNANAAIQRKTWESTPFNEDLTGLEDMFLAKYLVDHGQTIGYIADASVYHIHEESWWQIKNRYEREAIALQQIMPEVHFTLLDFCRYYIAGIFSDFSAAIGERELFRCFGEILAFRLMQYWGTYCGNQDHRKLSEQQKRRYYYPTDFEG